MCTAHQYLSRRNIARDQAPERRVSKRFMDYVIPRLKAADQKKFAELLDQHGITVDEGLNTTPNTGVPFHKSTSKDRKLGKDQISLEQAKAWAKELGIKIPANPTQGWIDRVHQAGNSGKQSDIDEANREAGYRSTRDRALASDSAGFATRWPGAARIGFA
jgi:hypothetical protein